jgi:5-oxoprolinase (ATP-hydrolysing)
MALADTAVDLTEPSALVYSSSVLPSVLERLDALKKRGLDNLLSQNVSATSIVYEEYLNLRYRGSDTALMVASRPDGDFKQGFLDAHAREFGFLLAETTDILVDDLRVRAIGQGARGGAVETRSYLKDLETIPKKNIKLSSAFSTQMTYFEETAGHVETPIYRLADLSPGSVVNGPAILLDATQTLVLPPPATATILPDHVWMDVGLGPRKALSTEKVDPIALSVFVRFRSSFPSSSPFLVSLSSVLPQSLTPFFLLYRVIASWRQPQ